MMYKKITNSKTVTDHSEALSQVAVGTVLCTAVNDEKQTKNVSAKKSKKCSREGGTRIHTHTHTHKHTHTHTQTNKPKTQQTHPALLTMSLLLRSYRSGMFLRESSGFCALKSSALVAPFRSITDSFTCFFFFWASSVCVFVRKGRRE